MNIFFADRIEREKATAGRMIEIYCGAKHAQEKSASGGALCPSCDELLAYAIERLNSCRFAGGKPACSKCPVHCYKKDMREKIREVMRFSGPRMIFRHPLLAVFHIFDTFRGGKDPRHS